MNDKTQLLRRVVEQATPGPWRHDDVRDAFGEYEYFVASEDQGRQVCSYWGTEDATADIEYIAAFDPVLVAAMLDVVDAAEAAVWEDDDATHVALNDAVARFRDAAAIAVPPSG